MTKTSGFTWLLAETPDPPALAAASRQAGARHRRDLAVFRMLEGCNGKFGARKLPQFT